MANEYTYRAEPVGALLPPVTESAAPSAEVLDDWTRRALAQQRDAGLGIVTDGEYRRHGLPEVLAARGAAGAPSQLVAEEAGFALKEAKRAFKVSLPAPSAALNVLRKKAAEAGTGFDEAATAAALSNALTAEIAALIAAGVAVVQLNGAAYAAQLDDPGAASKVAAMAELDRALLNRIQRSPEVRIGFRIGRPGAMPRWTASPALETLLALPADRFLLDIGPEAQDYSFLAAAGNTSMVVLGLIDPAKSAAQDSDAFLTQIDKAAAYIDADRLALSPRGGFLPGPGMDWDVQRRTLELLADVATRFWGFAM